MKSIRNLGETAASIPILADDILEFHAGRLLLLAKVCGTSNRIDGLTKMAKLDFFVRYPLFFDMVCETSDAGRPVLRSVESAMVRFHYGPWDTRYYHVLAYMKAKGLITVSQHGKQLRISLTELGDKTAGALMDVAEFHDLILHMGNVKKVLGSKSGSALKKMIYTLFDKEVAQRPLGEVIGSCQTEP